MSCLPPSVYLSGRTFAFFSDASTECIRMKEAVKGVDKGIRNNVGTRCLLIILGSSFHSANIAKTTQSNLKCTITSGRADVALDLTDLIESV